MIDQSRVTHAKEGVTLYHFADRLAAAVRRCGNPAMVGLDPRWEMLPEALRRASAADDYSAVAEDYADFCRGVIDVVASRVAIVKPQAAFF